VSYLLHPPRPIAVRTDAEGAPVHLHGHPLVGPVRPLRRWIADLDWWERPVAREYWQVLLRGRLLCEIYRDLELNAWFLERIYD